MIDIGTREIISIVVNESEINPIKIKEVIIAAPPSLGVGSVWADCTAFAKSPLFFFS